MSEGKRWWAMVYLTAALCLLQYFIGYYQGTHAADFSQACENAGGVMESAMVCTVPPPPEAESPTLGV